MSKTNRTKLLLDISTFVAFLVAMDPRTSGIAIHEWLAIALGATIVVHLLLNWNWIVRTFKRMIGRREVKPVTVLSMESKEVKA